MTLLLLEGGASSSASSADAILLLHSLLAEAVACNSTKSVHNRTVHSSSTARSIEQKCYTAASYTDLCIQS
jgi:hypothetical protein